MVSVTFANGKSIEVLNDTVVWPSGMSTVRNKMEIHVAKDAMSIDEFVALFSEEALKEIRIKEVADDKTQYDIRYTDYGIIASIGLQRVEKYDVASSQIETAVHLVAVLEQYTYIEKQLKALNVGM